MEMMMMKIKNDLCRIGDVRMGIEKKRKLEKKSKIWGGGKVCRMIQHVSPCSVLGIGCHCVKIRLRRRGTLRCGLSDCQAQDSSTSTLYREPY